MFRCCFCLLFAFLAGCGRHEPVGVVLTYATVGDAAGIDRQRLLDVVRRRVYPLASAKLLDDGKIEIGVYGHARGDVERVRDRLAVMGKLEFRIVADDRFDAELIEIANDPDQTPKAKVFVRTDDGKREWAAQWCAVAPEELGNLRDEHIGLREHQPADPQVLVLMDGLNVTGADLASVRPSRDDRGRPSIYFALSSDGTRRFGQLTGANLPDPSDPSLVRHLAIIFDGEIRSAPTVRSRIAGCGEIQGDFTEDEVDVLCATLSAGTLPARLELVSESVVEQQ